MEKLRLGPRPKFHLTWKELLGGGDAILGNARGWGAPDEVAVLQRGVAASGLRDLSGQADGIPPLQFQSTSKQYPGGGEGF